MFFYFHFWRFEVFELRIFFDCLPHLESVPWQGPSFLTRSSSQFDFGLLVSDFSHADVPTSLRRLARLELMPLALGLARSGFVFFSLVIDHVHLNLSLASRSFARPEVLLSTVDLAHVDAFPSFQSNTRLGLFPSTFSMARFELVFPPSVTDTTTMKSPLFPRGSSQLGFFLPALDSSYFGPPMLSRSPGHLRSLLFAMGLPKSGLPLATPDAVTMSFLLLLQSHARPGSVPTVADPAHSGSFASTRSFTQVTGSSYCWRATSSSTVSQSQTGQARSHPGPLVRAGSHPVQSGPGAGPDLFEDLGGMAGPRPCTSTVHSVLPSAPLAPPSPSTPLPPSATTSEVLTSRAGSAPSAKLALATCTCFS